jgi:hypothetical protein
VVSAHGQDVGGRPSLRSRWNLDPVLRARLDRWVVLLAARTIIPVRGRGRRGWGWCWLLYIYRRLLDDHRGRGVVVRVVRRWIPPVRICRTPPRPDADEDSATPVSPCRTRGRGECNQAHHSMSTTQRPFFIAASLEEASIKHTPMSTACHSADVSQSRSSPVSGDVQFPGLPALDVNHAKLLGQLRLTVADLSR